MAWGKKRQQAPAREPHPDGRIELQLRRILGCQSAIGRYELLIAEFRQQLSDISDEQDQAGSTLRGSGHGNRQQIFEADMAAQGRRMEAARTGISDAEKAIAAQHELITKLSAEMSDTDLAYL